MAESNGIIYLAAGEALEEDGLQLGDIILTGTAAGSYVFTLGALVMTITTGANDLTKVLPINRMVGYLKLTSGPANAVLYAFRLVSTFAFAQQAPQS